MKKLKESLRLYAITDSSIKQKIAIADAVEQAIIGGCTIIQYREKHLPFDEMLIEAKAIKEVCQKYGVPFIVNDYIELALEVKADGIHVGNDDCSVCKAREILGSSAIIGATAKTIQQAINAEKSSADYLGSGAVFGTATKSDAKPMSIDLLKAITSSVNIPVVAIGGINSSNVSMLKGTGISGVAVVGGIFGEEDIKKASIEINNNLSEVLL